MRKEEKHVRQIASKEEDHKRFKEKNNRITKGECKEKKKNQKKNQRRRNR